VWKDYSGLNNESTVTWVKLFTTPYPVQQIIDDLSTGVKTWIIPLPVDQWDTTPVNYSSYYSYRVAAHGVGVFTTHSSVVDASNLASSIGPLVLRSKLPALSTGRWVVTEAPGAGAGNLFAILSDFNAKSMKVVNGSAVVDTDSGAGVPLLLAADSWQMFSNNQLTTAWCSFTSFGRDDLPTGFKYANGYTTSVPPRITGLSAMVNAGNTSMQCLLALDVANGVIYELEVPYQVRGSEHTSQDTVSVKIAINNHLLKTETFWGDGIRYRGTFTDPRDGNVYRTVLMPDGNWWTIDNFKYNSPSSLAPNGQNANVARYGRLYTSADAVASAPSGCRLPTADEYAKLFTFTGKTESQLQYQSNGTPIPGYVGRIFHGVTLQLLDTTTVGADAAGRDVDDLLLSYDPIGFDLRPAGRADTSGNYQDFRPDLNVIHTHLVCVGGHWHQYWNASDFNLEFLPYLPGRIPETYLGSVRYIVESGNVPLVDPANYVHHTLSGMTVKDSSRGFAFLQMMQNNYKAGLLKHY
jgi:uncharacterized protein (TIGR02145 family)